MANSVDPDQTAPLGAVRSGYTLFAHNPSVQVQVQVLIVIILFQGAVQVLSLIQEILPPVTSLINHICPPPPKVCDLIESNNGGTTSQHYAILESDHPYKPATVANYKVGKVT